MGSGRFEGVSLPRCSKNGQSTWPPDACPDRRQPPGRTELGPVLPPAPTTSCSGCGGVSAFRCHPPQFGIHAGQHLRITNNGHNKRVSFCHLVIGERHGPFGLFALLGFACRPPDSNGLLTCPCQPAPVGSPHCLPTAEVLLGNRLATLFVSRRSLGRGVSPLVARSPCIISAFKARCSAFLPPLR